MPKRLTETGFTLVEITLVMAISSALVVVALLGFSSWRQQIQFGDSIDSLKETMTALRTEARANINLGTSPGEHPNTVAFGRLITFTPGSSTIQVDTLATANTDAPSNGQAVSIVRTETREVKWGVVYVGAQRVSVAFTQSLNTADMQTAWRNNWPAALSYGQFLPSASVATLQFKDPSGRAGRIVIDPANNGITRSIP